MLLDKNNDSAASFADLSVEKLARQAGMSRASFYLYFEDKSALVRGWRDAIEEQADDILNTWWMTSKPTRRLVDETLAALATLHRDNGVILIAIEEMLAHDLRLREERDEAFELRQNALREHIIRGQDEQWVDPRLSADTTASWLVAMLDRVTQHVVPTNGIELSETGADIIWRTLYT